MIPILFHLGPLPVYSFGVFMGLGFWLGMELSTRQYMRVGGDPDVIRNFLVWVFVAGLAGAKGFSVAADLPAFFANPGVALSGSGFVWYGGLLAGVGIAALLCWRGGLNFVSIADAAGPGLALGHAVGRIGCHVAGDGDWGTVTELPWGVAYTNAIIGWPHPPGVAVHPAPLYEMVAYLLLAWFLVRFSKQRPVAGSVFAAYLVGSSIARFGIEFVRIEPVVGFGLTQAQWIAILLFLVGGGFLAFRSNTEVSR